MNGPAAFRIALMILSLVSTGSAGFTSSVGQAGNPQALAIRHFEEQVKAYTGLRDRVKASLPPLKPTQDPAQIRSRQEALAKAVREARHDARQGQIFVPDVAPILRRLVAADFTRRTLKQRRGALREVPVLHLRVNDEYPLDEPLATVPPRLLETLPRLPDGLEYRFVGSSLILRDVNANLVVDVLDAAIPRR